MITRQKIQAIRFILQDIAALISLSPYVLSALVSINHSFSKSLSSVEKFTTVTHEEVSNIRKLAN